MGSIMSITIGNFAINKRTKNVFVIILKDGDQYIILDRQGFAHRVERSILLENYEIIGSKFGRLLYGVN